MVQKGPATQFNVIGVGAEKQNAFGKEIHDSWFVPS